jgi:hypothetical protein
MSCVNGNGYGRAKRASRVPSACQRRRRQKLKCDRERPCALCTRTGVIRIPENRPAQRKRRTINRDEINSPSQSPLKRAAPAEPLAENFEACLGNVINIPEIIAGGARELGDNALNYHNSSDRTSG